MNNTVSVTELRDFLDCRRKSVLLSKWRPIKPEPALWFGTIVHAGLAGYYSHERDRNAGREALKKCAEDSLSKISREFSQIWLNIHQEFDDYWDTAWKVYQNYVNYDAEESLVGDIVDVEKRYTVRLPNSDVTLTGQIDLVLDRADGLWVVDHKTASRPLESAALEVDEQVTGYIYLVWKKTGKIPQGFLFNTLVKSVPMPPAVLKGGGLSRAQDQPTTTALYLEEIQRRSLNLDDYKDYLTLLKARGWKRYFIREGGHRNLSELRAFEKRTITKAEDIQKSILHPDTYAYPAPSVYRCGYCPLIAVCKAKDDGGDFQALLDSQFARIA